MKRKVIQLAGKTLVVSLPSKWASKYRVKKGDEVEVEEMENRLVISQNSESCIRAAKVDVSGLSEAAIGRLIGAIYKAGYDEAEIGFESHQEFEVILEVVRESFVGFEIVNRSKSSIVLRDVALIQYGEFETILRRLFLVVLSMADEGFEAIKSRNKLLLKSVVFMDKDANKYANFCRRVLNKKGYPEYRKTAPLYYVVEQLEKLGDSIRDICRHVQDNRFPEKEELALYSGLKDLIRAIYELYYRFEPKKASIFIEDFREMKKEILERIGGKTDHICLLHISNALECCFEMSGPIITLNL